MAQVKFGSTHTIQKLDCLEKYLRANLKVFKNRDWAQTIYVDGFAGTGEIPLAGKYPELPLDSDGQAFIIGSVKRALEIDENFREYIFIEKHRNKAKALEQLRSEYPGKNIEILNEDANLGLKKICAGRDWGKCRAVVFLDPFGSQVEWSTIEDIAQTRAIDLWYLFPAGLSVHRQVRKIDGTVHESHQASLDRILGTTEWRRAFAEEVVENPDLFQVKQVHSRKVVTADSATRFMVERMKAVFDGGVLDEWLPLGSSGKHMFSLLFACANPSPKASEIAMRLARAVMRSGKRGRAK